MKTVQATWTPTTKLWWRITWRTTLLAVRFGLAVGIVFTVPGIGAYAAPAGGLAGIPIYIAVLRSVIGRRYADFQVVFVAPSADPRR